MSKIVEVPDEVYARIEEAASQSGNTVAEAVAARFPQKRPAPVLSGSAMPPRTFADLCEGLIGAVSLDRTDLAERHSELFAEGMEEKRRQGRL